MESLILKCKSFFNSKNKIMFISIILLTIIASLMFNIICLKLNNKGIYRNSSVGDRFYSYDDLYYVYHIYNPDPEVKYKKFESVIKHPLLVFGANYTSQLESEIYPELTFEQHYQNVVNIQVICTTIGTIFIFLILYNIFEVNVIYSFILSIIYLLANCTIISTILVESFACSAMLLVLSYYFISKKNVWISGLLGALILGTTITNVVIWGIMVLFLNGFKEYKTYLKMILSFLISSGGILLLIYVIEPAYLELIREKLFDIVEYNIQTFKYNGNNGQSLRNVFYYLFVSPWFYIDTVDANQLGIGIGKSISFIASANIYLVVFTSFMYFFIGLFISKIFKKYNKNILTCTIILLFNLVLHYGYKFGLYEAFLYTPHFFYIFIFLIGIIIKHYKKYDKVILCSLFIVLFTELLFNFNSISDMIRIAGV